MELMTKVKNKLVPWRRKSVGNHDVSNLRDDIDRIFDRFLFSPFDGDLRGGMQWGAEEEVVETSEGIVVRMAVPGIDPRDLQVTVRDGALHIEVEKDEEWGQRDDNWHGYRYGLFHRMVSLPEGLDVSEATATSKHGLMTVHIPWTPEAKQRSRRITVHVQ
jgi:HSP20 family protein